MNKVSIMLIGLLASGVGACRTTESSQLRQETDDRPTAVNNQLVDVSAQVNEVINQALVAARKEVKAGDEPWTDELKLKLINSVGDRLSRLRSGTGIGTRVLGVDFEVSQLTEVEAVLTDLLKEERHEIHQTKFIDSRYGDNPVGLTHAQAVSLISMATADHSISPTIRLGQIVVGLDKIGHFAEEGYWYFLAEQRGLLKGQGERFQLGQFMEGDPDLDPLVHSRYSAVFRVFCRKCTNLGGFGYYGMASTGVCSYGDIEANESGFQFYSKLYADPGSYRFDIGAFDVRRWSEEVSPNKYKKGLLVRPAAK